MNKKRANISVDPVVWENFRQMYPNSASEVLNDYMQRNSVKRDAVDVNIDIEKLELQRKLKQKVELEKEIHEHRERIEFHEEYQLEQEKKRLEKEKEQIQNTQECSFCGDRKSITTSGGKVRTYKNKIYCYSCFMKQS